MWTRPICFFYFIRNPDISQTLHCLDCRIPLIYNIPNLARCLALEKSSMSRFNSIPNQSYDKRFSCMILRLDILLMVLVYLGAEKNISWVRIDCTTSTKEYISWLRIIDGIRSTRIGSIPVLVRIMITFGSAIENLLLWERHDALWWY